MITNSMMQQEDEILRLQEENRYLNEDLRQCQADKEFVWSLWKKLQVANPDVTKAIALVLQREKEKAEIKDRKVLEILQLKDDKIEELQTLVELRSKEVSEISIRKEDVHDNIDKLRDDMDSIKDRNRELEIQVEASLKSFECREQSKDELHKSLLENLQQKNMDLQVQVDRLVSELDTVRAEKADCIAQRVNQENQSRILEAEFGSKVAKFEGLVEELKDSRNMLQRCDSQMQHQKKDLDYKNHELENVRKELSELWTSHNQLTEHSSQQADLIRQLQSLQVDTQKMLKNQEDAYSIEATSLQDMYTELTTRYTHLKRAESDLRHQLHAAKKELLDKDDKLSGLQTKVEKLRRKNRNTSAALGGSFINEEKTEDVEMDYRMKSMQREITLLKEELSEKDRQIDRLENEKDLSDIEFDVARLNRHERTHSTPSQDLSKMRSSARSQGKNKQGRSRSMSPTGPRDMKMRLVQTERKLEDSRNLLKLRNRELEELKRAHAKRLERLKDIQTNYKLVKEQLKTLEDENSGRHRKKKKVPIKRAEAKDLRKENSDAVWNELAYYKNENRTLIVEKLSIEEELDAMRVQASQDAATHHELRVALQQEKEGRQHDRRKTDMKSQVKTDQAAEIQLLQAEVLNKNLKIERLGRDIQEARGDNEGIQEEKRALKAEVFELKQESAQHRIEAADLRHRIKRLEQQTDEEKTKSHILQASKDRNLLGRGSNRITSRLRRKEKSKTNAAKQYQKSLNKSIEKMKVMFENFEEDGWEEITEEETEETESDTLGRRIVSRSQLGESPAEDSSSFSSGCPARLKMKPSFNTRPPPRTRRTALRNVQRSTQPSKSTSTSSVQSIDPARRVIMREASTSPMRTDPARERTVSPAKLHEQKAAHSLTVRQLKQMKQRVLNLQLQVTNLKESRAAALKTLHDQKETNQQQESDLNLANQRLRMTKQNIQKLTSDIEKLQQEKAHLENQLTAKNEIQPPPVVPVDKHTEQDWKVLEARLKASSNEVCRQSSAMRQLKQDNSGLQEQVRNLQDRINHLDRDNSQKRNLLEDLRGKLKLAQDNIRNDANSVEELETKIKLLQEGVDKSKIQTDSLKKRLAAVTREKREYEERFLKTHNELEKKTKQLIDCQNRKMELESSVSELESTAQQQLRGLASQSEAAIEAAQEKLGQSYRQIHLYQQFVKNLGHDLVKKVAQARVQVQVQVPPRREPEIPVNSSLQKAQNLAKNILNLSQSDIDDIMSADGDPERLTEGDANADKRRDRKWTRKCDKLISSKDDFAIPLMDLFVQKIDERCELLSKAQTTSS